MSSVETQAKIIINEILSEEIKSADDDIEDFYDMKRYIELIKYSTGIILGKKRNPMYGWEDITELSDENAWWNTVRGKMIAEINANGMITFNAEEGKEDWIVYSENPDISYVNTRTSLSLRIPNSMRTKFIDHMENLHFLVFQGISEEDFENSEKTHEVKNISMNEITYTNGNLEELSSISFIEADDKLYINAWTSPNESYFKSITKFGYEKLKEFQRKGRDIPKSFSKNKKYWRENINLRFKTTLLRYTTELTILDPMYNRPAHDETGLFSVIFDYLREEENYYTKGSYF